MRMILNLISVKLPFFDVFKINFFLIFIRSGTDVVSILILLFLLLLRPSFSKKHIMFRRFKSDRDEIWQECSSVYPSIDGVGFSI